MNKDLLNLICLYLNTDEYYVLKDKYKLNVLYYCKNTRLYPPRYDIDKHGNEVCFYCRRLNVGTARCLYSNEMGFVLTACCQLGTHWISDAIHLAAIRGHLGVVKYFGPVGGTCHEHAAYLATRFGHLEIVKYFVSINIKLPKLAMHDATRFGHLEIVKYFVSINIKLPKLAMHDAVEYGQLEIIKYFCSIGYKPTCGYMSTAAGQGRLDIVKYLYSVGVRGPYVVPHNANFLTRSKIQKKNLYCMGGDSRHPDVVEYLRSVNNIGLIDMNRLINGMIAVPFVILAIIYCMKN